MTKCDFCVKIEGREDSVKIFEDDKVVAVLCDKPATIGHIQLMPKEHYPIIEQVPDFIVSHLFTIANKLSVVAFESLNALGTNIVVSNGVVAGQKSSHFMINIIPRRENDGIDFAWQPKQLSQEELSTTELKIKEQSETIGDFEKEKEAPIDLDEENESLGDNDLQVHSLDRIP